jgi:hypothetical protein
MTTTKGRRGPVPIPAKCAPIPEPRSVDSLRFEIEQLRKFRRISESQIQTADEAIGRLSRELRIRQRVENKATRKESR